MKTYIRISNSKLFRSGLPLFLEYRTKALYGYPEEIPSLIREVVDVIMSALKQSSEEDRTTCTRSVCVILAENYFKGHNMAKIGVKVTTFAKQIDKSILALCVGVVQQNTRLIGALVTQGVSLWGQTSGAKGPIEIAAYLPENTMLLLLLKHLKKRKGAKDREKEFDKIVGRTYETKPLTMLISCYFEYFRRPANVICRKWLSRATRIENGNLIHVILDQGYDRKLQRMYQLLYLKKAWSRYDILFPILQHHNILRVNSLYHTMDLGFFQGSLLRYAVGLHSTDMVRAVLRAGANPNGMNPRPGGLEYPIIHAVMHDMYLIVEALLHHGADPQPAAGIRHSRDESGERIENSSVTLLHSFLNKQREASKAKKDAVE